MPTAIEDFPNTVRVVNRKTLARLINISERKLDDLIAAGDAPPSIKLSERRRGWRISDIEAWLETRREAVAA